jgi:DNA mismatch repair protein MLH1
MMADAPCTPVSDIKKKAMSQHKVRISLQDRTLDSMFPVTNPAQIPGVDNPNTGSDPPQSMSKSRDIRESECYLTSVRDLRDLVTKNKHNRACSTLCGFLC